MMAKCRQSPHSICQALSSIATLRCVYNCPVEHRKSCGNHQTDLAYMFARHFIGVRCPRLLPGLSLVINSLLNSIFRLIRRTATVNSVHFLFSSE